MGLFPAYIERNPELGTEQKKGIPKEYEIDFKTGQLTGKIVEGKEAIKIWIWLALQIVRYRHYIYSWDYGSELEDLIGKGYSEEYIFAEAQRMVEDCLSVNENIQSITDFSAEMKGSLLAINFTANTIYGEIEMSDEWLKAA